jgi:hypothetical protein
VNFLIAQCETGIAKLPLALEDDPSAEIMDLITQFCTDLKNAVYGRKEQKQLSQKNRERYLTFKKDMLSTTPKFKPFDGTLIEERVVASDSIIDSDSDFTRDDTPRTPSPEVKALDLAAVSKVIKE